MRALTSVARGAAYEALCALAVQPFGMSLRVRGKAGDEGVDLVGDLNLPPREQPSTASRYPIVGQCKSNAKQAVGSAEMRDFSAIVKQRQAATTTTTGLFFSQAGFTRDAIQLAFQQENDCPLLLLHLSCDFEGYAAAKQRQQQTEPAVLLRATLQTISPNRAWLKTFGDRLFVAPTSMVPLISATAVPTITCQIPLRQVMGVEENEGSNNIIKGNNDNDEGGKEGADDLVLAEVRYLSTLRLR